MLHLKCSVPEEDIRGLVSRVGADNTTETVIVTEDGFLPIFGATSRRGLEIGPLCKLYVAPAAAPNGDPAARRQRFRSGLHSPIWDTWSASIYAIDGSHIYRIVGDEVLTLVELHEEQLAGPDVVNRVRGNLDRPILSLTTNRAGFLYCAGWYGVYKVELPAALRSSNEAGGAAAAAGAGAGEPVVSRLRLRCLPTNIAHVADPDGGPGSLVYTTETALYRVQLGPAEAEGANPVLLAGREGDEDDQVDGKGPEARFQCLRDVAIDAEGYILCPDITDDFESEPTTALRFVAPDGTVTTLVNGLEGDFKHPAILPNGYLALASYENLLILDLGLQPLPLTRPRHEVTGPPARSLATDMSALLDRPDATADLVLQLGERDFRVHRAILSARCDYFKQRLAEGSGFPDAVATQLPLPDADPAAFELVLRFIYMGTVDVPPVLACAVAELSDRLLLPDLTAAACDQVLAATTPATVVDALLWAERCAERGGRFPQLLDDLKNYYVKNYSAVRGEAGDSLRRLAAANFEMMLLLQDMRDAAIEAACKRPRNS